ncbi:MAG: hypothetical protein HC807_02715, partial [Gammaproteobacteria bacterium]|nr:hypothetical protein [Gammaproteobacteria bacterium]
MMQVGDPDFSRRGFLLSAMATALAGCADLPVPGQVAGVERGHADVPGTRLYYETAGAGQNVVLIHAFMLH